jgi:hypothetical protein
MTAELKCKQMECERQPEQETQSTQTQPQQQPVTVVDSSVAGPFDNMAQGIQMLGDSLGQSLQQTNQLLAETAQINSRQTDMLGQLAASIAKQSGPKRITLPDGSVATTEPLTA